MSYQIIMGETSQTFEDIGDAADAPGVFRWNLAEAA